MNRLFAAEKDKVNKVELPFTIYVENNSKLNHFVPSEWMGDYGDVKISLFGTDKPGMY
jgi:hypothetical protein